jgi:predicted RNA binding protein YcfA (HicA-like mRNA interferase family)
METYVSVSAFPSMKGRDLLAVLRRKPLNYKIVRQSGSHRTLRAGGRPDLLFSFGNSTTIPPGLVRKILIQDIGLDPDEAHRILRG